MAVTPAKKAAGKLLQEFRLCQVERGPEEFARKLMWTKDHLEKVEQGVLIFSKTMLEDMVAAGLLWHGDEWYGKFFAAIAAIAEEKRLGRYPEEKIDVSYETDTQGNVFVSVKIPRSLAQIAGRRYTVAVGVAILLIILGFFLIRPKFHDNQIAAATRTPTLAPTAQTITPAETPSPTPATSSSRQPSPSVTPDLGGSLAFVSPTPGGGGGGPGDPFRNTLLSLYIPVEEWGHWIFENQTGDNLTVFLRSLTTNKTLDAILKDGELLYIKMPFGQVKYFFAGGGVSRSGVFEIHSEDTNWIVLTQEGNSTSTPAPPTPG